MSDVINTAVAALNDKMSGGFDGTAKFMIDGEGAIMIDGDGARAADDAADVTLTADAETFQSILKAILTPPRPSCPANWPWMAIWAWR